MKRQFFDGGVGAVRRASTLEHSVADLEKSLHPRSHPAIHEPLHPGQKKLTNAANIKKKAEQAHRPERTAAISHVDAQHVGTDLARARVEGVKAKAVETRTQATGDIVNVISSDPKLQHSLETITGKRVSSFGAHVEPEKINVEVSRAVNDIKSEAHLKADAEGLNAKKSLLGKLSDSASAAKKKLADSISEMKARFNERFKSTSERFPPELHNRVELEDVRNKTNEHLTKEEERIRSQRAHEDASTKADDAAHEGRQPTTDGSPETRPGEPKGEPKPLDSRTPEQRARDTSNQHARDEVRNREGEAVHERKANKAEDDARNIDEHPRDRTPEERLKDDVTAARERVKEHLDNTNNWRKLLRKFMGNIFSALMLILPIILPILLIPPMKPIGPIDTGPPFNPGNTFSPNVFPALPTGVLPIYRPYIVGNKDKPIDINKPIDLSGLNIPTFNEGYIIFTLTGQPDDDISFQVDTDSDKLELEQNLIKFPVDTWDTPIRIGFSTSLEMDLSGNTIYNRLPIKDKYTILRNTNPGGLKDTIYAPGSLEQYYPSEEEIMDVDSKLDNLLIRDETYTEAIIDVHKKVSKHNKYSGGSIEPTYEDSLYKPYSYEEIVDYTTIFDDSEHEDRLENQDLVEPTYDDDTYTIYEPIVEPSIYIDSYDNYDVYTDYTSIIDPTYEDDWSEYHEPVYGGEEPVAEDTSDINQIIDSLDYDTLASDIEEQQLSDDYKATIQIICVDSLSYEMGMNVVVEDASTWLLKPADIIFDESTGSNNIFFFSQNIFNELINLHVATQTQSIQDSFNNTVSNYESNQSDSINEDYAADADNAYKEAYNKSMQEQQEKIDAGEYVLDRLKGIQSGGYKSYYSKLRGRSRRRKVE